VHLRSPCFKIDSTQNLGQNILATMPYNHPFLTLPFECFTKCSRNMAWKPGRLEDLSGPIFSFPSHDLPVQLLVYRTAVSASVGSSL